MFLRGVWDDKAARHDDMMLGATKVETSFTCTTGVMGKCVAWGYAPWKVGADLHQSCVRMGRADYCGGGVSFTKNGTPIDLYDVKGIQTPTDDASMIFEAGWGVDGAVCVSRARYEATATSGERVLPSCWSALPKCTTWSEASSRGAVIGNSSRIQSRTLCTATAR
jgi:hypothetical protein